jgi:NTP pyrophosphatase (non-canonical NTP hydrolase)
MDYMADDRSTEGLDSLEHIRLLSGRFVEERNWQSFQTPKNLAMAMIVEAAELVEHFQWLSPEQSLHPDTPMRDAIAEELSDVLIYLVRMADVLDIDLGKSAVAKIAHNAIKYPVAHTR